MFAPVWHRRTKYFLTPQFELYRNIAQKFGKDADTVLDYGCGNGVGTLQFAGRYGESMFRRPLGVDVDEHAIAFAQDLFSPVAEFVHGDLLDGLRLPQRFYQLVMAIEVLEHVPAPVELATKLLSLLKPGGILVCSTVNRNGAYRKNEAHEEEWTPAEFRSLFPSTVKIVDFSLEEELADDSTKTPMVAALRV